MECKRDREEISAYLDGELDLAARQELESHLETCAACRELVTAQRKLSEAFAALPQVTPRGDFEARYWARIARERDSQPTFAERLAAYFSFPRLLALGAGVAAAVTFAIMLPQSPTSESPAPEIVVERKVADPDVKLMRNKQDYELLQEPDMDAIADVDVLEVWDDGSPG